MVGIFGGYELNILVLAELPNQKPWEVSRYNNVMVHVQCTQFVHIFVLITIHVHVQNHVCMYAGI